MVLIVILAGYVWLLESGWSPELAGSGGGCGGIRVVLTIAFEAVLGRYISGQCWEDLLQAYNVMTGSLWRSCPEWCTG